MKAGLAGWILAGQCLSAFSWSALLQPALTWNLGIDNGYDSNALRLSPAEKRRAAVEPELLGSMTTFDSYYYRLWSQVRAGYRLPAAGKSFRIRVYTAGTGYLHTPEKTYGSAALEADYSWGPYRHLKVLASRLQDYYLRHYLDRDLSVTRQAACRFSDGRQELTLSLPVARRTWITASAGFLQRYYSRPFPEFDLDITYGALRLSRNYKHRISISGELETGHADNITFGKTARSSRLDRSYDYLAVYVPVRLFQVLPRLAETGTAVTTEWRFYRAEDPDDPLHSGRSHRDVKFDLWGRYELRDRLSVDVNLRIRSRFTSSQYAWVESLKSYRQVQSWLGITWTFTSRWR